MAKITTNGKNHIKNKNFGLPATKQYPLTDRTHVRMAIAMFSHCPADKKSLLAQNIKRRLKELKMSISIAKDSAFYPYAGSFKEKK